MSDMKKWIKTGESNYAFIVNDKERGQMIFHPQTIASKADIVLDGNNYLLQRKGFWKTQLELLDGNGFSLMRTYHEKWYAHSSVLEYESKKYKLLVRNNPLAEWAILDNNKEWLAYGLTADKGTTGVKITSAAENNDWLLDFLLWYLFVPVAQENSGDNAAFFMMTIS
jgi:hypothetical protein